MEEYLCPETNRTIFWLNVNEYTVTTSEHIIKTILGSCVGIILFDLENQLFGVNHYLNSASGVDLNRLLLEKIKAKGAKNIKAVIAGGANTMSKELNIGKENIELAQQFLQQENIPITKTYFGNDSGLTLTVSLSTAGIEIISRLHKDKNETAIQEEILKERETSSSVKSDYKGVKDALEEFKKLYEQSCMTQNKDSSDDKDE